MIEQIKSSKAKELTKWDSLEEVALSNDAKKMVDFFSEKDSYKFLINQNLHNYYMIKLCSLINENIAHTDYMIEGTQNELRIKQGNTVYGYLNVQKKSISLFKTPIKEWYFALENIKNIKRNLLMYDTRIKEIEDSYKDINDKKLKYLIEDYKNSKEREEKGLNHSIDYVSPGFDYFLSKTKDFYEYLRKLSNFGFVIANRVFESTKSTKLVSLQLNASFVHSFNLINKQIDNSYVFYDTAYLPSINNEGNREYTEVLLSLEKHSLYNTEEELLIYEKDNRKYTLDNHGLLTLYGTFASLEEFLTQVDKSYLN